MTTIDTITDQLAQARRVLMVGLGGQGMRGLAYLLHGQGKIISGTDQRYTELRSDPSLTFATLVPPDDVATTDTDLIIATDAVAADHPWRQAALRSQTPLVRYADAVGALSRSYTTIAVTGTHGKSSTTAMVAHILEHAGYDPTALIGAPLPAWQQRNARSGHSQWLVVEADEYQNHFLALTPQHAIITTIDLDHPDFFASLKDVVSSFATFVGQCAPDGTLVTTSAIYETYRDQIPWPAGTIAVSQPPAPLNLPLPGDHMQHNAWLAVTLAVQLGINESDAIAALEQFPGLGRRFEVLGTYHNLMLISDYGHHPAEIDTTLRAAREKFSDKRLLVLLEPHTEERFVTFFAEFKQALSHAVEGILICPIYRARQSQPATHTSHELAGALQSSNIPVWTIDTTSELQPLLTTLAPSFDVAIAFTAGELDSHLRSLVRAQST